MPVRVVVFTETYAIGGAERFVADLVAQVDATRAELVLAGNRHPDFGVWLSQTSGSPLSRHTARVSSYNESLPVRLRRSRQQDAPAGSDGGEGPVDSEDTSERMAGLKASIVWYQAMRNFFALRRQFRSLRPDVVLINNGGYPGARGCQVAAIAAKSAGVARVVHFVHNTAVDPAWPEPLERWFDRRVDGAVDLWLTAAESTSDALSETRLIDRRRVRTVYTGVPEPRSTVARTRAELGLRPDGLAVLLPAAFEPRKGHGVALQALRILLDRGSRAQLVLAGSGTAEDERRVLAAIARLNLSEHVSVLGRREDMDTIYPTVDVMLLPSLSHECFPYVNLEAMAHRLPIVSTRVAGIPEQIQQGISGFVVPPGDAEALADALERLESDPDLRAQMGVAGRRRFENAFRIEERISELTGVLLADPAS